MATVHEATPRQYSPEAINQPTDAFRSRTGLPIQVRAEKLNRAYVEFDRVVGEPFRRIVNEPENRDAIYGGLKGPVQRQVDRLLSKYEEMNSHASKVQEALNNGLSTWSAYITEAYKSADQTTHDQTREEKAAARINALGSTFLCVTDFDNTVTEGDDHVRRMPTSQLEVLLQNHGRHRFTEFTVSTVHSMLPKDKKVLRDVGREHVVFREGFGKFILYTKDIGAPRPIIVSANYEDVLYGALEKKHQAHDNVSILSITQESDLSRHKDLILKYYAAQNPETALFFIGDGSSDIPALEAKDTVAFYFALEDSSFHRECEKRGVLYFTFKDFNDVQSKMRELMSKVEPK